MYCINKKSIILRYLYVNVEKLTITLSFNHTRRSESATASASQTF